MRFTIYNDSSKEVLLGLEPEGDTVPLAPDAQVELVADSDVERPSFGMDIGDGLFTIYLTGKIQVYARGALRDPRMREGRKPFSA